MVAELYTSEQIYCDLMQLNIVQLIRFLPGALDSMSQWIQKLRQIQRLSIQHLFPVTSFRLPHTERNRVSRMPLWAHQATTMILRCFRIATTSKIGATEALVLRPLATSNRRNYQP